MQPVTSFSSQTPSLSESDKQFPSQFKSGWGYKQFSSAGPEHASCKSIILLKAPLTPSPFSKNCTNICPPKIPSVVNCPRSTFKSSPATPLDEPFRIYHTPPKSSFIINEPPASNGSTHGTFPSRILIPDSSAPLEAGPSKPIVTQESNSASGIKGKTRGLLDSASTDPTGC